jgi:hypothetical protein
MSPLPTLTLLLWAAQAASGGSAPDEAASETRFFPATIDFWKSGPKIPAGTAPYLESIWAEPVREPDGRFSIYVPPKLVLDFLENPTPENLKGYLDWKRARTLKLRKALELLREHASRESESGPAADPSASLSAPAPAPSRPPAALPRVEVIYFHGKGCPHCTEQDPVLAGWLLGHPEASVRVLERGESPELWLRYRVRGTPSLLLSDASGDAGILLEGLSDGARLDRALGSLRGHARPPGPSSPEVLPPESSLRRKG